MPAGVHECGPGRIFQVQGPELVDCFEKAATIVRDLEEAATPERPVVLVGVGVDVDDGWSMILTFEVDA